MKNKSRSGKKVIILGAILTILLVFLFSNYLRFFEKKEIKKEIPNVLNISYNYSIVKLYVPAVDNSGNGVLTVLKVYAMPGSGRTLVDINQLLFWIDTQQSIQLAKKIAQEVTKIDLSHYDIVYSIEDINATVVEGPSAGAALTIATIAAIEGKSLKNDVVITGTINPDGTIGQVGGIIPKAQAAKEGGAKIFLVPKGQGTQVNYIPNEECEKIGYFTFCRITYKKEVVNVGKSIGIDVIEVSDIKEAMKYFGL